MAEDLQVQLDLALTEIENFLKKFDDYRNNDDVDIPSAADLRDIMRKHGRWL